MLYKKCLASALPLGLLCYRVAVVLLRLEDYRTFWYSDGLDWLRMPFPYAVPVLLFYAIFVLTARWGPFLVPLGSAAAPWLPRSISQQVYIGCCIACVPVFLGEGFLYLVCFLDLGRQSHVCEMPLADLALLGINLFGMYLMG